jgi:hypothetical protein
MNGKDCGCGGLGRPAATGISHHSDFSHYSKSVEEIYKVSDGVNVAMQLLKYFHEQGTDHYAIKLQLLESVGGAVIRHLQSTFYMTIAGKRALSKAKLSVTCDTVPFKIQDSQIEFTSSEKSSGVIETTLKLTLNVTLSGDNSVRELKQILTADHSVLKDCFGVEYRCAHDTCEHWPHIEFPCNYRCQSRINSNNGTSSEWTDTGNTCGPPWC